MALFPCDVHGGRYQGPQQTIYPTVLDGVERTSKKLRLCPMCFDAIFRFIDGALSDATLDDHQEGVCPACKSEPGALSVTLFATVYGKGAERQDFYGVGCADHKAELLEALGLA